MPSQQELCVAVAEGEVLDAELLQVASGTEDSAGQPRQGSPGERDRRALRHSLDHQREQASQLPRVEQVDVVEHEQHGCAARAERPRRAVDHGRRRRAAGGADRLKQAPRQRRGAVDGREDVLEKDERVVVALVDRHPGHGPRFRGGPLCEQRGLSVPCPGDGRDHGRPAVAEPVGQRRPRDHRRWQTRGPDLGVDDVERGRGRRFGVPLRACTASRPSGLRRRALRSQPPRCALRGPGSGHCLTRMTHDDGSVIGRKADPERAIVASRTAPFGRYTHES